MLCGDKQLIVDVIKYEINRNSGICVNKNNWNLQKEGSTIRNTKGAHLALKACRTSECVVVAKAFLELWRCERVGIEPAQWEEAPRLVPCVLNDLEDLIENDWNGRKDD